MTPDQRRAWDEATIMLLRATTPVAVLAVNDADERGGIPAYSDVPGIDPRDVLLVCAACGHRFWARPTPRPDRFCSVACYSRAYRLTHAAYRERRNAYARARHAANRASRRAA